MHIGKKDDDGKDDTRKALEEEVDAMMDPKRPDDTPSDDKAADDPKDDKPKVSAVSVSAEPARTAPKLSDDLRKKIGVSDADTKPLSIDELDKITVKISDTDKNKPSKPAKDDEPDKTRDDEDAESEEPEDQEESDKDLDDGTTDLDDARTEEAVADIVSHEGDVMLAVEDATRKEHNPELKADKPKKKKGHRVLATIIWTLVAFVAIIAVLFLVLLVTGGDVTAK